MGRVALAEGRMIDDAARDARGTPAPGFRLRLRVWLREPLLHFLILGAALFALDHWRGAPAAPQEEIRVTAAEVRWLAESWSRTAGRPPSADDLARLIADLVREEALAREARALGLDEGDVVVRRRLVQKLEFMAADTQRLHEPSEAELRAFHAADPARFAAEPAWSFEQVLFSARTRPDPAADAAAALARPGGPRAADGDPSLLAGTVALAPAAAVAAEFGAGFAEALAALAPGRWGGPVASPFGAHLVRVTEHRPGRVPPFDAVRERVALEWRADAEAAFRAAFVERVLSNYRIAPDEAVRTEVEAAAALLGVRP